MFIYLQKNTCLTTADPTEWIVKIATLILSSNLVLTAKEQHGLQIAA